MFVGYCEYLADITMNTNCHSISVSESWLAASKDVFVYFFYQQQYFNLNNIGALVDNIPNNYLY
jgi:hypothetical protein